MIQIMGVTSENKQITNVTIDEFVPEDYTWYWIDFNKPTREETEQLSKKLHFHPLAIEDCIHSMQRSKLDFYDDFYYVVTHTVGRAEYNQHEMNFFIGENSIVTFHYEDLSEVNTVWNEILLTNKLETWSIYRVFYEIMDKVVDNFFPIIHELEDEIKIVENNPENKSMEVLLDRLFLLRHELLELRHAVNPIRDLLYRIINSHHLEEVLERREYFIDVYDHLLKISEMINSNREITNDIRNNFISLNSYQQNKVIQILTVITSIFSPLTFIAGIYGMNFLNMPELEWKYGYFIVLGVMLAITVGMIIWFKKKGWLW
ncbi:magnesium/cobalt transporter CorA [Ornithinibacillus sp. L9]|uniref:Magnesium transport protein CorA n=1 Tax=Ornithinibacillus caprae TaxID=2678566 RepID=A0A6N8FM08_9BACI|nr:magnesium/cobalt transporter CorA [Ornithinibacillus caprae]MUK90201.1 magnesium/cobalt transporter CorA [Ornithinibacillus caprae]